MTTLYVQSPTLYLAGSGVVIGATSITLTDLVDIYGNVLTMSDFGSIGYITLEPDTTNSEAATFTGVTANANGTYTLTGVKTILAKSPYTQTSGLVRNHAGGTKVVITDNTGFWETFLNKNNNETVVGLVTFPNGANRPVLDADTDTATSNALITYGQLARTAIAGGTTATTTLLGYVKVSVNPASPLSPVAVGDNDGRVPTQSENDALVGNNTDIAVGSGNKFVTQTGFQKNAEKFAADAGGTDSYAITLSPVPTSYATGMVVVMRANTANTGAATLNVNSLGAKTIVKGVSTTLSDGDIGGSMLCTLVYDGTNFVLQNPTNNVSGLLTSGAPGTTTTNTTATVLTYSLAGGTLGTNRGIKIRFSITDSHSAVSNTCTYTVKYGGTTITTFQISTSGGTPTFTAGAVCDVLLMGSGATNTQHANMFVIRSLLSGSGINATLTETANYTASIDSTSSQNITIECTAGASVTGTFVDYFIEKIV